MLLLHVDYPKYSLVSLDSFAQAIRPKPNDFKNILLYGTIPNWLSHGIETQNKQAVREVRCFCRPCPSSLPKAIYYDCEERKYWGFLEWHMFWGTARCGVVWERGTQLCKQSHTPPFHTHTYAVTTPLTKPLIWSLSCPSSTSSAIYDIFQLSQWCCVCDIYSWTFAFVILWSLTFACLPLQISVVFKLSIGLVYHMCLDHVRPNKDYFAILTGWLYIIPFIAQLLTK